MTSEQVAKKSKPVSLLELFFDLVFVFAISKLTGLFEPGGGAVLSAVTVLQYLFSVLIILQVWLYQTNYNNRFGRGKWFENLIMLLNMMAVLFMSNTIGIAWGQISRAFDLSMIVMLGSIAVVCFIYSRRNETGSTEAASYFKMLLGLIAMYGLSAILYSVLATSLYSQIITVIAGVLGAFLPALVRRGRTFDVSIIDFPHLTERCELLAIVTFGEMVTAVSKLFSPEAFGVTSVLVFAVMALLFGVYVLHNHCLMDRKKENTRGAMLMLSHYLIVIALSLITVGFLMLYAYHTNETFISQWQAVGSILFFGGLFLNGVYYPKKIWKTSEKITLAAVIVACTGIMLFMGNGTGTLLGLLLMSGMSFVILYLKKNSIEAGYQP